MNPEPEARVGDRERQFLRHTVATLAYRGAKSLRGAPETFADFRAGEKTRTPAEILAHVSDLLDWGLSLAMGAQKWHNSPTLPWNKEVERFFVSLEALDWYLDSPEPLKTPVEQLFQGPVADALTHIGQIAMLRRLAGVPVRGENYLAAGIKAGKVGSDQASPSIEFD